MIQVSNSPQMILKKTSSAPLLVILSNPGSTTFNFASNMSALLSGGGISVSAQGVTTQFEVTDELWAIATPPETNATIEMVIQ